MRLFCFVLQILKLLLGLDDLTLQGIILFRADWISKLVRYILCLLFQTGQFICRFLDFPLQCIVFLLRDLTLGKLFICGFCLFLEVFQLGFGLGDLLLDRVVFRLPRIVVVIGFCSLLACLFQCIKSCLGILHCLTEQLLFLSKQFRICRVELQQLLHIFELRLRVFDVLIDTLQCFGKFRGITVDFNGNALDSACHTVSPPRQGIKKAPAFQQVLNSKIYIILGGSSLG
jgi:hypothetical protein